MGFVKRVENFKCEKCGQEIKGNGYTNHCPVCLWSKHTDIKPGDRKADCLGLMEPIEILSKKQDFHLIHKCLKCGLKKTNIMSGSDNIDLALNNAKNRNRFG